MQRQSGKKQESSVIEEVNPDKVGLLDLIEKPAWKTILIDLVKTEKMDPWDIDLVKLSEKYLEKINSLSGTDLRIPANAILASAILLKFKSEALKVSPLEEEEELSGLTPEQKQEIESMLPELHVIKSSRQGKVTLDELVSSLEKIFEKTKDRQDQRPFGLKEVIEFKLPASNFNIEEMTKKVFQEIKETADSTGLVLFSKLIGGKNSVEIVDTFIPCLFLTNKGKINMWQEEFFGEIFLSVNKEKDS